MKNGDLTPLKSPKNRPRRHEVALRRRNFGAGRWTAGAGARAGPGGDRSGKKTCMKFSTHRIHVWYIYIYICIYTNIGGILMGSMLPAPWILWGMKWWQTRLTFPSLFVGCEMMIYV